MSEDLQRHWRERFETLAAELERRDEGSRVDFVIADGFLMFYDEASVKEFDVRLFVREGSVRIGVFHRVVESIADLRISAADTMN